MQGSGNPLLIQRYGTGLHPHIRGEVPFIVRGPNWSGRHVMRQALRMSTAFLSFEPDEVRLIVAEWMLREGFCMAAWPVEMPTCQPEERRWAVAVRQVADEIPKVSSEWPIDLGAWELLDGMSTIEHYRHVLVFDDVLLESMPIPSDSLTS